MFKKGKNNLDERQENKLLHIEKNGFWFMFWALFASMFLQMFLSVENLIECIAAEWIIFMCTAVYVAVACLKNGIWDRKLKADPKTNLIISLIAAVFCGVVNAVINYRSFGSVQAAVWCLVICLILVAAVCFCVLSLCTMFYKKRLRKMEETYEE